MEQLDKIILSFDAFVERGGDAVPFSLCVGHPDYDDHGGHYCLVECPFVRDVAFKIYGADEAQACELSIFFVRQRITDMDAQLVDKDGSEIDIPEIIYPPQSSSE